MNHILHRYLFLLIVIALCTSCSSNGETTDTTTNIGDTPDSTGPESTELICVDTFPFRDGMGVGENEQPCELGPVVFMDAANPPMISLEPIEALPDSEPLFDALTAEQLKVSYGNGATIRRLQADESTVETYRYTDSKGMTADVQLDDNKLFNRVIFSDGTTVDYEWHEFTLVGTVLTDNTGAMFFFDFVDERFYQTDFLETNQLHPLFNSTARNTQDECRLFVSACIGIDVAGAVCSTALIVLPHFSVGCVTLGLAAKVAGILCKAYKDSFCGNPELEPEPGNWCTVIRGGDKVCTSGPYAACQVQHANYGEPSPFLGMSERENWWSKSCEWNTCGGLARPDCTLILPGTVSYECEDRINFVREFPGTCMPRNQSN